MHLFLADMPDIKEEKGPIKMLKWVLLLPPKVLFYFTIPDCRVEK
jgi:hypothetical protein